MANPIKIYEIKGEDWTKGLSYKSGFQVGGLFNTLSNFDPFENYGFYQPSLDAAVTDSSITASPVILTSWNDNGTAKIYSHTANALYEVLDGTPYTTTNESGEINVSNNCTGAIIYNGRYVYAQTTEVRSNILPVASGSDVQILTGFASSEHYHVLCVGSDKYLYVADFGEIGQITSVTGTSGNTTGKYLLESGFIVRDMVNDGNYLVVIADNNQSQKIGSTGVRGKFRCQVLFYDVNGGRSTPEYIYEFTDSYLVSVKYLDGVVYIFGRDNFWACNSVTAPKAIFNFNLGSTITEPPQTPYQVTIKDNSILWAGQTNGRIYAYGSLFSGTKKVFYQPFATSAQPTAILWQGTNLYVGTSGANNMLSVLGTGSTRSLTSGTTAPVILPQPFKFAFARVVLRDKLASGGEVIFGMFSIGGNGIITDTTTKQFSTVGSKQTILYNQENDGAQASEKLFNDFSLTIGATQAIARVEVWAYPVDNYDQSI